MQVGVVSLLCVNQTSSLFCVCVCQYHDAHGLSQAVSCLCVMPSTRGCGQSAQGPGIALFILPVSYPSVRHSYLRMHTHTQAQSFNIDTTRLFCVLILKMNS